MRGKEGSKVPRRYGKRETGIGREGHLERRVRKVRERGQGGQEDTGCEGQKAGREDRGGERRGERDIQEGSKK